jgi:hypothetical protein
MQPTVYKSVDAAVEDLTKELPVMEQIKATMERTGKHKTDPQGYEKIRSAIELPKDRDSFRQGLEQLKNPDGSIQFSFTPEAWKLFRDKFPSPR